MAISQPERRAPKPKSIKLHLTKPSSNFSTPIFTIIAGPNQKAFYAHADVLCKAANFRAVVHGDWKETHQQVIDLTAWDEDIVGSLLDYLYTEDYVCPLPQHLLPHSATDEEAASIDPTINSTTLQNRSNGYNLRPRNKPVPKQALTNPSKPSLSPAQTRRNSILHRTLTHLKLDLTHPSARHDEFIKYPQSPTFNSNQHSLFPPIMYHATLYVLADFILLPSLKASALYRLLHLMNLNVDNDDGRIGPERSVATIEVARFVYANTMPDTARWVVSEFLALKLDLLDDGAVAELVNDGGDLMVDVVSVVRAGMKGGWEIGGGK